MADDIRAAAIEAACIAFTAHDMPSFARFLPDEQDELRANLTRAIAAYESALWRPIEEAPKHTAVIIASGRTVGEAFQEDDGRWNTEFARHSPSHFHPLPAPPEDEK